MARDWVTLAIASGLCAGLNGFFAKLTTTELTTSIASSIAHFLTLPDDSKGVEYIVRAGFFGLNLVFNGIMWTIFTMALSSGESATKVSIVNTTSNFMITAILGWLVFSEKLPPMWWLGASMLLAGNIILGQKSNDDGDKKKTDDGPAYQVVGSDDSSEGEQENAVPLRASVDSELRRRD